MQVHLHGLVKYGGVKIGDFLCGFFVGEMLGSALSAFQVFHKREPTPQEHMEIVEIIENYSEAITEFFSQFNS